MDNNIPPDSTKFTRVIGRIWAFLILFRTVGGAMLFVVIVPVFTYAVFFKDYPLVHRLLATVGMSVFVVLMPALIWNITKILDWIMNRFP